jgi:glycosyltransferase involved in cell wall biosynthesis
MEWEIVMIGYLFTTFNDSDQCIKSYKSLIATFPPDTYYGIVIVDGGSTESELQKLKDNIPVEVIGPYKDLSVALNQGIYYLLGYPHNNISEFVKSGISRCSHVAWIHCDMAFHMPDTFGKLAQIYDYLYPLVGRLAPGTSNIDNSYDQLINGIAIFQSNNCPWIMGSDFLKEFIEQYGRVYDERYLRCYGVEDIAMWQETNKMGKLVCITGLVDTLHEGMGTRKHYETSNGQLRNREIYHKDWDNGVFNNTLGPDCTYDLTEINKDLLEKFKHFKDEVTSLLPLRDEINKEKGWKR